MTMVDYQKCLERGDLRSTSLARSETGENGLILFWYGTLRAGFALRRPARTSKDGDRQERFNPIRAENHAQSRKIASKKGLKIAEKMNQAYFLSYIALISIYKLK